MGLAEKFKIMYNFFNFSENWISDTILEFLTVWKGKEGKNGVKYRKEAILVTYEMIDIVDAMTRFVAQPTQDIRVQNCKKTQKLTQILNFYCTWQVHIFAMSALRGEVYNATFVIGVEEIAWLFNLIAANSQVLSHSVEKSILKVSLKKIQKNFRTKNQPLNSKKYLIVESRARFLSAKFKNETFLVIFKHCDMLCKKPCNLASFVELFKSSWWCSKLRFYKTNMNENEWFFM